eukprot:TRINITY_DN8394_c0_g1_i4.p1 TRINITY_DN8394_c0_g1~~TRINITY_DN8394_c0_g1_i4.p1  ORF type:complete len:204 (+),score=50.30 TRINITY_DN8394_c0_g1_i4:227-838(+)
MGSGASAEIAASVTASSVDELKTAIAALPAEGKAKLTSALAAAEPEVRRVAHVATLTFAVEAPAAKVATFLTMPASWVALMGLPEGTATEPVGSDGFKVSMPEGKVCWMTELKSEDGADGAKVFSYKVATTNAKDGDAGLKRPIFSKRNKWTVTPDGDAKCNVERVTFEFEQWGMLQVDLPEMLKSGMIAKENATLAEMCKDP